VALDDLPDFFKQCGVAKMNKRSGQPMTHIYLDKETGNPKGDTRLSYEDPPSAKDAVEWFDGKDFQGSKLKVSFAQKKSLMNSMWGGMPPYEGRGMPSPLRRFQVALEGLEDPWVTWETMEETKEASPEEEPGVPKGTSVEKEMSNT
jgi:RNA recognition motif-containing protein